MIAADPMLVEAESFGVNIEQLALRFPILTLTAHALAKYAGIQFAAARVANPIQDAVGFGRQFFPQALFKVRSDAARQTNHVDESLVRAAVLCALQEPWNVRRQTRNRRRDTDANLDAGIGQHLHRGEASIRRWRERLDGARDVVIGKRN